MKNLKIARRYAKALLLIGKEDGQIEALREELSGFCGILKRESILLGVLENPIYQAASRKGVLQAVLQKLNLSKTMNAFLTLLFDKGRMNFILEINDIYGELADDEKGIARATLTSAGDLVQDTVDRIRDGLSKMTGKEVLLTVKKDPALIGGVVTRIGDLVLDGSVRTQLNNLKESLKRSEAV